MVLHDGIEDLTFATLCTTESTSISEYYSLHMLQYFALNTQSSIFCI